MSDFVVVIMVSRWSNINQFEEFSASLKYIYQNSQIRTSYLSPTMCTNWSLVNELALICSLATINSNFL